MIREALEASRAQLIATLGVIDLALAALDQREQKQPEGCRHANKVDVSTFMNPGTFYCRDCQLQLTQQEEGVHHG